MTVKDKYPKAPKRPKHRPCIFGVLMKWMFVLSIWVGIIVVGLVVWYAQDLPDMTKGLSFERRPAIIIKAENGDTIARYGDLKGQSVTISDIPAHLIYAVIATEDRRFYQHMGIDPMGIARAAVSNVMKGRLVQGGSTITQQLAKNLFLTHERTFRRKIQEAFLALWLERELTKDEILSAYLNRVYMGSGAYGVDAAARLYFDKPVSQVTLREAALLAGLLKAPSRYSPMRNPDLAEARAKTVIAAMKDAGYVVDESQYGPMPVIEQGPEITWRGENTFEYFGDWVVDRIDDSIGTPETDLIVETTLVPDIQKAAEKSVKDTMARHGEARQMSEGAALVLSTDGAVRALVGGKSFAKSQFNRATQATRQPGSTFKPFVYLAALQKGWTPDQMLLDTPITDGDYRPENFEAKYHGGVSMKEALAKSMNTASVRLIREIGPAAARNTARALGITSNLKADASLALGSYEVTLMEMVGAYAGLAQEGRSVQPYAITKIYDLKGNVFYERKENGVGERVIPRASVRTLNEMLQAVIRSGTGKRAQLPPSIFDVPSGKTGTSQNFRDAWFVGYTDDFVAGVWVGNDDNTPMKGVTGGSYPAAIWRDAMAAAYQADVNQGGLKSISGGFGSLLRRLMSGGSVAREPTEYND